MCAGYVFGQILTATFLVGSLVEITNPVPSSQALFPQFRVIG